MKLVGLLVVLLLVGPGFLTLGIRTLSTRGWRDGVPAAELLIDHALGAEPPARTAWDRRFARFHAVMMLVFGAFFSLVLAAVLYSQFVTE